MANSLKKEPKTIKKANKRPTSEPARRFWTLGRLMSGILTIITILGVITLLPTVVISLGDQLNPRDPFSRGIVIRNQSYYSVSPVTVEFVTRNVELANGGGLHDVTNRIAPPELIPGLEKGEAVTLSSGFEINDPAIVKADVIVTAEYSIPWVPMYKGKSQARFVAARGANGIVWQEQPVEKQKPEP